MIVNFSIQNYKSVNDNITLTFEPSNAKELSNYYLTEPIPGTKLLKIGLIYGPNGSGKTTILKALDLLRDLVLEPADKKSDALQVTPFLFSPTTQHANTKFALEFIQNQVRYEYTLELNNKAIVDEKLFYFASAKKSTVFHRTTDTQKQLSTITFGSRIRINKNHKEILEANTLWNNTVLGGFLKTNIDAHELREATTWFKEVLMPLITPRTDLLGFISAKIENQEIQKESMLTYLQKADFKISDITLKNKNLQLGEGYEQTFNTNNLHSPLTQSLGKQPAKEIWFKHSIPQAPADQSYEIIYDQESQGTQRYYQFSGILDLMIRQQHICAIDELESSLHPDLTKHFLLVFLANVKHSQLIATTHYRELLMERDIIRHDAIWFTDKKRRRQHRPIFTGRLRFIHHKKRHRIHL